MPATGRGARPRESERGAGPRVGDDDAHTTYVRPVAPHRPGGSAPSGPVRVSGGGGRPQAPQARGREQPEDPHQPQRLIDVRSVPQPGGPAPSRAGREEGAGPSSVPAARRHPGGTPPRRLGAIRGRARGPGAVQPGQPTRGELTGTWSCSPGHPPPREGRPRSGRRRAHGVATCEQPPIPRGDRGPMVPSSHHSAPLPALTHPSGSPPRHRPRLRPMSWGPPAGHPPRPCDRPACGRCHRTRLLGE